MPMMGFEGITNYVVPHYVERALIKCANAFSCDADTGWYSPGIFADTAKYKGGM